MIKNLWLVILVLCLSVISLAGCTADAAPTTSPPPNLFLAPSPAPGEGTLLSPASPTPSDPGAMPTEPRIFTNVDLPANWQTGAAATVTVNVDNQERDNYQVTLTLTDSDGANIIEKTGPLPASSWSKFDFECTFTTPGPKTLYWVFMINHWEYKRFQEEINVE